MTRSYTGTPYFAESEPAYSCHAGHPFLFKPDVIAEVNGAVGAFVIHTVSTAPPPGTSALSPGNDSTTDQDPIVPDGLFANGFENAPALLTVPGAAKALLD